MLSLLNFSDGALPRTPLGELLMLWTLWLAQKRITSPYYCTSIPVSCYRCICRCCQFNQWLEPNSLFLCNYAAVWMQHSILYLSASAGCILSLMKTQSSAIALSGHGLQWLQDDIKWPLAEKVKSLCTYVEVNIFQSEVNKHEVRLDKNGTSMMRWMDGWVYVERKEEKCRASSGQEPIKLVKKLRLRWFEHVEGKDDTDWEVMYDEDWQN